MIRYSNSCHSIKHKISLTNDSGITFCFECEIHKSFDLKLLETERLNALSMVCDFFYTLAADEKQYVMNQMLDQLVIQAEQNTNKIVEMLISEWIVDNLSNCMNINLNKVYLILEAIFHRNYSKPFEGREIKRLEPLINLFIHSLLVSNNSKKTELSHEYAFIIEQLVLQAYGYLANNLQTILIEIIHKILLCSKLYFLDTSLEVITQRCCQVIYIANNENIHTVKSINQSIPFVFEILTIILDHITETENFSNLATIINISSKNQIHQMIIENIPNFMTLLLPDITINDNNIFNNSMNLDYNLHKNGFNFLTVAIKNISEFNNKIMEDTNYMEKLFHHLIQTKQISENEVKIHLQILYVTNYTSLSQLAPVIFFHYSRFTSHIFHQLLQILIPFDSNNNNSEILCQIILLFQNMINFYSKYDIELMKKMLYYFLSPEVHTTTSCDMGQYAGLLTLLASLLEKNASLKESSIQTSGKPMKSLTGTEEIFNLAHKSSLAAILQHALSLTTSVRTNSLSNNSNTATAANIQFATNIPPNRLLHTITKNVISIIFSYSTLFIQITTFSTTNTLQIPQETLSVLFLDCICLCITNHFYDRDENIIGNILQLLLLKDQKDNRIYGGLLSTIHLNRIFYQQLGHHILLINNTNIVSLYFELLDIICDFSSVGSTDQVYNNLVKLWHAVHYDDGTININTNTNNNNKKKNKINDKSDSVIKNSTNVDDTVSDDCCSTTSLLYIIFNYLTDQLSNNHKIFEIELLIGCLLDSNSFQIVSSHFPQLLEAVDCNSINTLNILLSISDDILSLCQISEWRKFILKYLTSNSTLLLPAPLYTAALIILSSNNSNINIYEIECSFEELLNYWKTCVNSNKVINCVIKSIVNYFTFICMHSNYSNSNNIQECSNHISLLMLLYASLSAYHLNIITLFDDNNNTSTIITTNLSTVIVLNKSVLKAMIDIHYYMINKANTSITNTSYYKNILHTILKIIFFISQSTLSIKLIAIYNENNYDADDNNCKSINFTTSIRNNTNNYYHFLGTNNNTNLLTENNDNKSNNNTNHEYKSILTISNDCSLILKTNLEFILQVTSQYFHKDVTNIAKNITNTSSYTRITNVVISTGISLLLATSDHIYQSTSTELNKGVTLWLKTSQLITINGLDSVVATAATTKSNSMSISNQTTSSGDKDLNSIIIILQLLLTTSKLSDNKQVDITSSSSSASAVVDNNEILNNILSPYQSVVNICSSSEILSFTLNNLMLIAFLIQQPTTETFLELNLLSCALIRCQEFLVSCPVTEDFQREPSNESSSNRLPYDYIPNLYEIAIKVACMCCALCILYHPENRNQSWNAFTIMISRSKSKEFEFYRQVVLGNIDCWNELTESVRVAKKRISNNLEACLNASIKNIDTECASDKAYIPLNNLYWMVLQCVCVRLKPSC